MLKNLRMQLLVSGLAALCVLLAAVWFITRGHVIWAVVMIVVICLYIIGLNRSDLKMPNISDYLIG